MYIYKFLNIHDDVLYVGRTANIQQRLKHQHFTKNGHLPQTCYDNTHRIHYAEVASLNEAKTYELYYIERYKPQYNTVDTQGGVFTFELQELIWKNAAQPSILTTSRLTKQDILSHIEQFQHVIAQECQYTAAHLRHQDQQAWLDKLSDDERNNYLQMVYRITRFVENIQQQNEALSGTLQI